MDDVVTKADLARELGVSRSAITQHCANGLPVRPDGKLNRSEALRWLAGWVNPSRNPGKGADLAYCKYQQLKVALR